jgi:L-seryl-tRNA(Ser) seleniumtransferase
VLVDAAADFLVAPNPYIAEGADLVAYSGGKISRGPQGGGLLVGKEQLVRAAFANSAPHHAFGRPMKVSKEEIIGVMTAVEVFFGRRDLQAEYREWESWYRYISKEITKVDGVSTHVARPSRGGPFPVLMVEWDPAKIGLTAGEVGEQLLNGKPRIATHASGGGHSFRLRPVAMKPRE